jgi:hypothetical protein
VAKYDALRIYLAGRPEQVSRVAMSFGEVEALVGSLPASGVGVGADYCVTSCDLGVFVDEAAESITSQDTNAARWRRIISPIRRTLFEASVGAVGVVMIAVVGQDMLEVTGSGDEDPVGAFAADAADPAFGDRVRLRRPNRSGDDLGADGGEYGVEGGGEFGVPVPDHETDLVGVLAEVHEQVAGLLRHPCSGRVGGDAGEVNAAGVRVRPHLESCVRPHVPRSAGMIMPRRCRFRR